MSRRSISSLFSRTAWVCKQCRSAQVVPKRAISSTTVRRAEVVTAAPKIDFENTNALRPARIIPASPSYFTGSPVFNDNLLRLQSILTRNESLPILPPEEIPRMLWLKLSQYRSSSGEYVAASKYAQILRILSRLNRIHPRLRSREVLNIMKEFQRPGSDEIQKAKPGIIDEYGRSKGVGRRKESSAKVYLVEGAGEILVNGKNIVRAFPRLHDRESAMWALKVSERVDKYNVFAVVSGGGITGQAEAVTLAVARALLVHEPALKPLLRRAGCVTRDPRRVERKKPGHVKARKMPTWVKR